MVVEAPAPAPASASRRAPATRFIPVRIDRVEDRGLPYRGRGASTDDELGA
jgi:hypothetical protein